MFFITLEASPKPSHERYGAVAGAFASCWVNELTSDLAEQAVRAAIEANGWDALDLDECRVVTRQEFIEKRESLELFDQASIDGLVITFHTWPVGGDRQ